MDNYNNNSVAIESEELEKGLSLGEIFFIIKKNIILILVITMVCTVAAGVYGFFFKEYSYTATTSTMVMVDVTKKETQTSTEYSNYMYSIQLINTYEDFVTSRKVIQKTVDELKDQYPDLNYKKIKNNLSLSNSNSSLVVRISYTAHGEGKGQEAIDVVNTLVNSTIDIVNNSKREDDTLQYSILSKAIEIVDYAEQSEAKRGATLITLIGMLVGLAISFFIVLISRLLDDTYKSKEEFERQFKIDVIATIPDLVDAKGDSKDEK